MKECRGCQRRLPVSDFYVHPRMADGHLNFCADCVRTRVRRHRAANQDRIRAADRARGFRVYDEQKVEARRAVHRALRKGELRREPCLLCGATQGVQAHHPDHSQPLQIAWLCSRDHGRIHQVVAREGEWLRDMSRKLDAALLGAGPTIPQAHLLEKMPRGEA